MTRHNLLIRRRLRGIRYVVDSSTESKFAILHLNGLHESFDSYFLHCKVYNHFVFNNKTVGPSETHFEHGRNELKARVVNGIHLFIWIEFRPVRTKIQLRALSEYFDFLLSNRRIESNRYTPFMLRKAIRILLKSYDVFEIASRVVSQFESIVYNVWFTKQLQKEDVSLRTFAVDCYNLDVRFGYC